MVALAFLGANLPEDAIYPYTEVDGTGQPLNGTNHYMIHFAEGQLPPINAFWSLAIYGEDHFFVKNPINRYAIGDRDKLVFDEDGSLNIYIQHEAPKSKGANWLPAPRGNFNVIMRMYWPKPEVIDGTWKVPPVKQVNLEG